MQCSNYKLCQALINTSNYCGILTLFKYSYKDINYISIHRHT